MPVIWSLYEHVVPCRLSEPDRQRPGLPASVETSVGSFAHIATKATSTLQQPFLLTCSNIVTLRSVCSFPCLLFTTMQRPSIIGHYGHIRYVGTGICKSGIGRQHSLLRASTRFTCCCLQHPLAHEPNTFQPNVDESRDCSSSLTRDKFRRRKTRTYASRIIHRSL